jgi:hypothetical protein
MQDVPTLIAFLGYDPEPHPSNDSGSSSGNQTQARVEPETDRFVPAIDPCTLSKWELCGTIMKPEHRTLVATFTGLSPEQVYRCMKRQWNETHEVRCSEDRVCSHGHLMI